MLKINKYKRDIHFTILNLIKQINIKILIFFLINKKKYKKIYLKNNIYGNDFKLYYN